MKHKSLLISASTAGVLLAAGGIVGANTVHKNSSQEVTVRVKDGDKVVNTAKLNESKGLVLSAHALDNVIPSGYMRTGETPITVHNGVLNLAVTSQDDTYIARQINFVNDKGETVGHATIKGTPGWKMDISNLLPSGYELENPSDANQVIGSSADTVNIKVKSNGSSTTTNDQTVAVKLSFTTADGSVVGTGSASGNVGQVVDIAHLVPSGYQISGNGSSSNFDAAKKSLTLNTSDDGKTITIPVSKTGDDSAANSSNTGSTVKTDSSTNNSSSTSDVTTNNSSSSSNQGSNEQNGYYQLNIKYVDISNNEVGTATFKGTLPATTTTGLASIAKSKIPDGYVLNEDDATLNQDVNGIKPVLQQNTEVYNLTVSVKKADVDNGKRQPIYRRSSSSSSSSLLSNKDIPSTNGSVVSSSSSKLSSNDNHGTTATTGSDKPVSESSKKDMDLSSNVDSSALDKTDKLSSSKKDVSISSEMKSSLNKKASSTSSKNESTSKTDSINNHGTTATTGSDKADSLSKDDQEHGLQGTTATAGSDKAKSESSSSSLSSDHSSSLLSSTTSSSVASSGVTDENQAQDHNGEGTTATTGSAGTTTGNNGGTNGGTVADKGGQTTGGGFAQTGGTGKLSSNRLYDFIYLTVPNKINHMIQVVQSWFK